MFCFVLKSLFNLEVSSELWLLGSRRLIKVGSQMQMWLTTAFSAVA